MTSIIYIGMDVHITNYTLCCYTVDADDTFAVVNVKPDYHEILKYMDRVRSTRGGDSTDFVKFRPRRWVANPFASSILLTVDRSGLRIHAS